MGVKDGKAGGLEAIIKERWESFDRLGPWGQGIRTAIGVAALVLVLVFAGIFTVKQLAPPGPVSTSHEPVEATADPHRRILPLSYRAQVVTALRSLPPQRFEIARTGTDADSIELAEAILAELRDAHWKNDSGVGILVPDRATGVTIRMKKTTEPAVYLLKSLNMAGIQAQAFADVPTEKTYDVDVVVGPAP